MKIKNPIRYTIGLSILIPLTIIILIIAIPLFFIEYIVSDNPTMPKDVRAVVRDMWRKK